MIPEGNSDAEEVQELLRKAVEEFRVGNTE
jgi:hypothetical protein